MSSDSSRSVSSSSSKRGRLAANPWSSSAGGGNPKKDATGRATAASATENSPASSGSRSRKAPFPDFGSYMVEKNRKLREQFDAEASTSSLGSSGEHSRDAGGNSGEKGIFRGVSIFVDGYTVPSSQELKAYMLKHGGRFENYFSRRTVTHIICSHLPDSKMKNLRSFSRGLPVVKPTWVLDSVAANRLLNWVPYQLDELVTGSRKQQKLSAFFTLKSSSVFDESETAVHSHVQLEASDTLLEADESEVERVSACLKIKDEGIEGSDSVGQESFCERKDAEQNSAYLEDGSSIAEAQRGSRRLPYSNPQHSTTGDLNFVENYFKTNLGGHIVAWGHFSFYSRKMLLEMSNAAIYDPVSILALSIYGHMSTFSTDLSSRLHFIGTWRSRYRKRFLNAPNSAKWSKPDVRSASSSPKSVIIHVDMDCFFVSVVLRNHPEMFDKPVAICHSDNARGTAEISSANYPARVYGVHAGMLLRDAKVLCPQLAILPYNFEAYEEVADQLYTILHENCPKVQAVSCDEAFLDVTGVEDPEKVASTIRQQIAETTGCTASAGIAGNMLLARLATRSAKPNGQFCIWPEKVDEYLKDLPIEALPGIGSSLEDKLKNRDIKTCGQLQVVSKESLQKDFGRKAGEMLWNHCRGIDNRMVDAVQEMKSIGAEVNWGVRFNGLDECHFFLKNLCKEVSTRLKDAAVKGKTITLKVKKRKEGADEPIKYMGCGDCENMSRSTTVSAATDSLDQLFKISKQLFASFHVDAQEVRGVGLQLSKLESADITNQGKTLESWLASTSEPNREPCERVDHQVSEVANKGTACWENQATILPPMSHLDMDVVKCLPPEIVSEMDELYQGRLSDIIEKHGNKKDFGNDNKPMYYAEMKGITLLEGVERESMGVIIKETGNRSDHAHSSSASADEGKLPVFSSDVPSCKVSSGSMHVHEGCMPETDIPAAPFNRGDHVATGSSRLHIATAISTNRADLMPTSLSQVDESILQQLPEELKVDLCKLLPAHRNSELTDPSSCVVKEATHQGGIMIPEDNKPHLWAGSPPNWVIKFKNSSCQILKILSETYQQSGSENLLSSCLQSLISHAASLVASDDAWHDEALSSCCEFLRQYIELKVKSDMEELYLCFCILKRLTTHSKFFSCVYNAILPSLQASVSESYGGTLQLSFA